MILGRFPPGIFMYITSLRVKNWKNFAYFDIPLKERAFLVGPNASGKSNFLDIFRFLRDIAKDGGGLQKAGEVRGGLSKIRCLAARGRYTDVEIDITIGESESEETWRYLLSLNQKGGGIRDTRLEVRKEQVWKDGKEILSRPNDADKEDASLLEFTYLEQPTANRTFVEFVEFIREIEYLHVVPQLVRDAGLFRAAGIAEDPFGRSLIENIQKKNKTTRDSFLKRINEALSTILPQFKELSIQKDANGIPHLEVRYKHWRDKGAKQNESQFSDGTLRFIGLFWALQDGNKPILLEEPELSLHAGVISYLPEIIARLQRKAGGVKRQVILSTHSAELLSSETIGWDEVIVLDSRGESTELHVASGMESLAVLREAGMRIDEAVMPATRPDHLASLVDKLK